MSGLLTWGGGKFTGDPTSAARDNMFIIITYLQVDDMDCYGSLPEGIQIYTYGTGGGARRHKHFCSICLKGFHKKHRMEEHVMVVHEGRKFYCDLCGKGFTRSDILKTHKSKEHSLD